MKKLSSLLVLSSILLLTACGSTGKTNEGSSDVKRDMTPYGKYEKPVEFTIGRNVYTGDGLPEGMSIEDNAGTQYVEEMANVKAKVVWETQDTKQKIALSMSTGDIPDVMIVSRDQFKQLVENDLIADMTEVYDKVASDFITDMYGTFGDVILDQVTVDGKLMGIPGTSIGGQQDILWIRKDWLEKSGKNIPTTEDEVVSLAKSFIEEDYAGDGKTTGIVVGSKIAGTYNSGYTLNPLFYANQSYPRQWIEKNGQTEYGTIQPETKKALEKISTYYKEGVIDKQFAVRKLEDMQALVKGGQAGMLFFPWWAPYSELQDTVTNDPNADWVAVSAPVDSNGKINVTQNDPIVNIVVVRKEFAHPEAVMKSINLSSDFIYQTTKEAEEFTKKVIPDAERRWDHLLVQIPTQIDYNDVTTRTYNQLTKAVEKGSPDELTLDLVPTYNNYESLKTKKEPFAWADIKARFDGEKASFDEKIEKIPVNFFDTTETMKNKWANLEKLEDEMFVKIITGEEPIDYFDTFVENWKKLGGDTITQEVNDSVTGK